MELAPPRCGGGRVTRHRAYPCTNKAAYRLDWPDDVDKPSVLVCRMHLEAQIDRMLHGQMDSWVTVSPLPAVKPSLTVHRGGAVRG